MDSDADTVYSRAGCFRGTFMTSTFREGRKEIPDLLHTDILVNSNFCYHQEASRALSRLLVPNILREWFFRPTYYMLLRFTLDLETSILSG
jgi:hypothetical protein